MSQAVSNEAKRQEEIKKANRRIFLEEKKIWLKDVSQILVGIKYYYLHLDIIYR